MLQSIKAGMLIVLAATLPAIGQHFVQQGNVLDANNRLGSGGLNYAGPGGYQPNSTNRIVTGNVTAGAAFRGYSPIRDPNSFFLGQASTGVTGGLLGGAGAIGGLPSDQLTTFRRDSVGINELRELRMSPNMTALPFYSRSSTVADTGQILRGLNQPGSSQLQSSYVPIQRNLYSPPTNPLDAARRATQPGNPLNVDTQLIRADTGGLLGGPVNRRLLGSPLFGGVRQVPLSSLAKQADEAVARPRTEPRATPGEQPALQRRTPGLMGERETEASPLERFLNAPPGTYGQERATEEQAEPDRMGQARLRRPVGERELPAEDAEPGRLARRVAPPAEAPSVALPQAPMADQTGIPLQTFTGTPDERIKDHLAQAEKLLREQRYYDAARRYEMAHAIDLRNPLPLFGRGMALLAAGDYVSSANDLFLAVRVAGPGRAVQVDLREFIPDVNILDQRRAFLEQRLETYEDFRLRFLLGWAEYMSGMPELGLANMAKAAKAAPENMDALRQFVDGLQFRQATQPADAPTPAR